MHEYSAVLNIIHNFVVIQRPLWRHYYQNTTALIYVVDSNDRDRIEDCKYEIHRLMQEEELKDIPMLVMANKQDLPNAMSIAEITDKLDLHKIKGNPWRKNIIVIIILKFNH